MQGAAERWSLPGCPSCVRPCTSTPCSPSPTATSSPTTPTSSTRSTRSRFAPATRKALVTSPTRATSRSSTWSRESLGLSALRDPDGWDVYASRAPAVGQRQQRVALEPGVVFTYDRNTTTNTPAAQGRRRGHHDRRRRARARSRRRALHDLPDHPGRRRLLSKQASAAVLLLRQRQDLDSSSVTAIVCSLCAVRQPVALRSVHPSASVTRSSVSAMTQGSSASISPGAACIHGRAFRCSQRAVLVHRRSDAMTSELGVDRVPRLTETEPMAWEMSPMRAPGPAAAIPALNARSVALIIATLSAGFVRPR